MNDWLSLMLDEIRRKQREREEAAREREQRQDAGTRQGAAPDQAGKVPEKN